MPNPTKPKRPPTSLTISVKIPTNQDRDTFLKDAKNQAEKEARKVWNAAFPKEKNKGGRPKEAQRTLDFFEEVLKETGGKLPENNRTTAVWIKAINAKWKEKTGKTRNPLTIAKQIRPRIKGLPFPQLPSREQAKQIPSAFAVAYQILEANLLCLAEHLQPLLKEKLSYQEIYCLLDTRPRGLFGKILKECKTDPLLKQFLYTHFRLDNLLIKIKTSPNAKNKQLSWLREAFPGFPLVFK